jgi:SAM-dependent methyltransferase
LEITPLDRFPPPEDHFGDKVAARYDESSSDWFGTEVLDPTVEFLAELAGNGPALELGIGTGRVALPLAKKGIRVHGIDLSAAMVARLRAKSGGDGIKVAIGDFATTRVSGSFSLAYLVFNTITNLTTQDAQSECFANVAEHLEPGGRFVIENYIPALQRLPPGETHVPFLVTPTRLGFDEYDVVTQTSISHHYRVAEGKLEVWSSPHRYVWPSELDLMARHAGMTLRERWATWTRKPFTATSASHISVWEKTAP